MAMNENLKQWIDSYQSVKKSIEQSRPEMDEYGLVEEEYGEHEAQSMFAINREEWFNESLQLLSDLFYDARSRKTNIPPKIAGKIKREMACILGDHSEGYLAHHILEMKRPAHPKDQTKTPYQKEKEIKDRIVRRLGYNPFGVR